MPPEDDAPRFIEDFVPSLLTNTKGEASPPPAKAATETPPEIDESDDLSPDDLEDDAPLSDDESEIETEAEPKPRYRLKYGESEVEVDKDELEKVYAKGREWEQKQPQVEQYEGALTEEYAKLQKSRLQYDTILARLDSQLAGVKERTAGEWSALRRDDEIAFAAEWAEHQQRKEKREIINAERSRLAEEQRAETAQQLNEYVRGEQARLLEKIPTWKDEKRRAAAIEANAAYAKSVGFTDQEVGQAYDHRMVLLLDKARRYDELLSKKEGARKQVEAAPQMAEPGARTRPMPQKTKAVLEAKKKFEKSGKIEDAMLLMLQ